MRITCGICGGSTNQRDGSYRHLSYSYRVLCEDCDDLIGGIVDCGDEALEAKYAT